MGKIAKTVMVGAAGLGVAAGSGGCSVESINFNWADPREEANLAHSYDDGFVKETTKKMAAFWQNKGYNMAGITAEVVQGSTKIDNCGPDEITSKTDQISICSDGRIIAPAQAVNNLRNNHGEKSRGAIIGILGHEVGHHVLKVTPDLLNNAPTGAAERGVYEERFATCIGGLTIYASKEWIQHTDGAYNAFMTSGDTEHYGGGPAQASAYSWAFSQMDADPNKVVDPVKCVNMPAA